jgi:hypothetical protein
MCALCRVFTAFYARFFLQKNRTKIMIGRLTHCTEAVLLLRFEAFKRSSGAGGAETNFATVDINLSSMHSLSRVPCTKSSFSQTAVPSVVFVHQALYLH